MQLVCFPENILNMRLLLGWLSRKIALLVGGYEGDLHFVYYREELRAEIIFILLVLSLKGCD